MASKRDHKAHVHHKTGEVAVIWLPADLEVDVELKIIDDDWRSMAHLVGGGYIEVVHNLVLPEGVGLKCGCALALVVNEEGLLHHMPPNARASKLYRGNVIVGDAFLIGEGPTVSGEDIDIDLFSLHGDNFPSPEMVRSFV